MQFVLNINMCLHIIKEAISFTFLSIVYKLDNEDIGHNLFLDPDFFCPWGQTEYEHFPHPNYQMVERDPLSKRFHLEKLMMMDNDGQCPS
jgi:hypothetical protein